MLNKHLALYLLGSALIAAPAVAQNNPTPTPGAPAPATTTAPAPSGSVVGPAGNMNFIDVRPQDQFRASKLIGSRVYGSNDERIGEINDVLMDQSGKVHAVVIGVGGFLGIGEKDVALPMNALQFRADDKATTARRDTTTTGTVATPTGPATTTAPAPANPNPNASANAPAGTTTTTTTTAQTDDDDGVPDRIVLSMTKDQLNQAPTFRDNPNAQRGTTSTTTTAPANPNPPTTAPRQ